jgi:hypothetical protein
MPHGGRLAKPFAAFHAVGLKKLMKVSLHVADITCHALHQYLQLPGISGLQLPAALLGVGMARETDLHVLVATNFANEVHPARGDRPQLPQFTILLPGGVRA